MEFSALSLPFPLSSCRCHSGIFLRGEKMQLRSLRWVRELQNLSCLHVSLVVDLSQSCHITREVLVAVFERNA